MGEWRAIKGLQSQEENYARDRLLWAELYPPPKKKIIIIHMLKVLPPVPQHVAISKALLVEPPVCGT